MARRLLIAAGESAETAEQLPFGVRDLIAAADEIMVITPALPSRLEWLASATDRAREQADERLRTVLGQLAELRAEATGTAGADDPLLAFEDAIRDFAPDHILVGLRGPLTAGWQERRLLERLQERFSLPMTIFSLTAD